MPGRLEDVALHDLKVHDFKVHDFKVHDLTLPEQPARDSFNRAAR